MVKGLKTGRSGQEKRMVAENVYVVTCFPLRLIQMFHRLSGVHEALITCAEGSECTGALSTVQMGNEKKSLDKFEI